MKASIGGHANGCWLGGQCGLPRVQFASPEHFFEQVERDKPKLVKWVGELYFEYHRGKLNHG